MLFVSYKRGTRGFDSSLKAEYKQKVYVRLLGNSRYGRYDSGTDKYAYLGVGQSIDYTAVCLAAVAARSGSLNRRYRARARIQTRLNTARRERR